MQVSNRGPRLPIIVDTAGRAEAFASALDEDSQVTHDLSLIGATALEATPECVARLAQAGFRIYEDPEVEIPRPEEGEVVPQLDVAARVVGADQLWRAGIAGQGVTVAVIDTGIAPHDDLGSRLIAFEDLVNHRDKPYDDHGHGTHVAGIVGGDGSRSNHRHLGIAPRASLVGIKAFDSEGKGKGSDVVEAIQWAVANKQRLGIEVINLSARSIAKYSYQHDPMARAVAAAWDRGIVPVVAAGNDGPAAQTIGSPAHAPKAISVGGLDDRGSTDTEDDRMYRGSSRGPTPVDGLDKPDVVAPGVNIRALSTHNGYVTKTGTSMAAPMVSGLVALLLTQHHEATPAQVKQAVTGSAEQLPRLGDRHDQGSGLVNAPRALAALSADQAVALVEA